MSNTASAAPAASAAYPVPEGLQSQLEDHCRWFHQHPEPSYGEVATTARIREILTAHGIEILDTGLRTGLVARIEGTADPSAVSGAGHVVAVRGDIDGLPITEQTGVPYASLNEGYLHGCGHDYNLTTALGAALILAARRDSFAGTVKVIFQPAEEVAATKEVPTGAVTVINTGALKDVEAFYGVHDTNGTEPGVFVIHPGPDSGAVDKFRITINGKGTHAAHPNGGANPIRTLAALIDGIQSIAGQDVEPSHPRVVTVTHVESGKTWNVIAPTAFLEGTARTAFPEDRVIIHDRFQALVNGLGAAYGTPIDFEWEYGAPSVVNDEHWSALAADTATALGLTVTAGGQASLGGEDFSYYLQEAPGAFIHIGVGNADRPMHGPTFFPKLDALADGANLLATVAQRTLAELGA
ncbi:amidohydrolase [Bifidobacterium avesanii]|uniref:Amidohydrolase n=1 Tax=Bifidobacterium avesanii TaxID=1798157 RepID=A0A7K3TJU1_9BIFI|nr:amidohydrolase [Bifidobacterium avesanii]KAB8290932.1 amidohydrolase [Bifidobacterium avesanii]NEG78890.1 amidohydrolase [Bifidobacterium avesanii]